MSMSGPPYSIAGEILGATRMEIVGALYRLPIKMYLPDDNNEIHLDAEDFRIWIEPCNPEGGTDFMVYGNFDLDHGSARDLINTIMSALEEAPIAASVELTSADEDDVETFETIMWDSPARPLRQRARPELGARLRTGTGDEVRAGTFDQRPVLITLTTRHAASRVQLINELRLAFDGIAPLVSIRDAQEPYDDMMIERLPAGMPAAEAAPLEVQSLALLGKAVADVLARVHAGDMVIAGVQPELIYVDHDGRFTGLVPRGPRFIYGAPQPLSGPRSYPVPYIGHEELVLGNPPSPAGDVFALCASLFVLGTGIHPFGDPSDLRLLIARVIADQREPWPAGGAPAQLLARGLAQRPEERPTAADLARELALLAGEGR